MIMNLFSYMLVLEFALEIVYSINMETFPSEKKKSSQWSKMVSQIVSFHTESRIECSALCLSKGITFCDMFLRKGKICYLGKSAGVFSVIPNADSTPRNVYFTQDALIGIT